MRAIRRFVVRTVLPEPLQPLEELATNLRWSWDAPTRDLFEWIDPELWRSSGQDPVRVLGEVHPDRLQQLATDGDFLGAMHGRQGELHDYLAGDRWYQSLTEAPRAIAYFSPEFGIAAAVPQYSGGLGILAGDHLKTASDLGVPIIGVGLYYRAGYFRQTLSREGWQQEHYPVIDPDESPASLLRDGSGTPATIAFGVAGGRTLTARIWVAQVGRVPLLLLDTDVEENAAAERDVTDRLYGGGEEHRLEQELLLGVGGVRAIRAYCAITGHPAPEVFHSNEGHAGFLGIERIRELMVGPEAMSFDVALEAVRAGTVFTTHTPVPAGIDRFPRDLISQYVGSGGAAPGVPIDQVLDLGAEDYPGGDPTVFNMAVMGLRLGQRANGVSRLHGVVSRGMFNGLWSAFDAEDVPITSITNGVHAPTWVAREMRAMIDEEHPDLSGIGDDRLWWTKRDLRVRLVDMARQRLRDSWLTRGASLPELGWIDTVLDPDILTIGFARRVPSYKRLTLMLREPDRLRSLLLDPERPIQLVIAGKSHPADDGGKRLIQEMVRFSDDPDVRHRIVFLPNYEIGMATDLYPGCDVWLNNPIRPLEASGTSGMKAALNGALNLSVLDGWWDEWFDGQNGWAIPTADGVEDPDRRDDIEARGLYDLIEHKVAPTFYAVDHERIPRRWVEMMRHTLTTLGPKVLATRMVRDYVSVLYCPAAQASRAAAGDDYRLARELAGWKAHIVQAWPGVRVEHVETDGVGDSPTVGTRVTVRAFINLGALSREDVRVEAVYGRVDSGDHIERSGVVELLTTEPYDGNRWRYEASIDLDRTGPFGLTVRVLPIHEGLATPVELGLQSVPVGR